MGKKETKFRRKLKEIVGEPPVIYDPILTGNSTKQLNLFLKNKGYFNSTVSDSTSFKKKKAKVHYYIESGKPYKIRKITFSINDTGLIKPIRVCSKRTLMKPGHNYDANMIAKERERMSTAMKNLGYYSFSKEFIYFQVDSALNKYKVDLKLIIKNPIEKKALGDGRDTLLETKHQLYFIRNIYINTNYDPKEIPADTLLIDGYYFLNASRLQFRPEVLLKNIFVKNGDIYRLRNQKYTNTRLAGLKTFKFISIRHTQAETGSPKQMLDCHINLTPTPKQSFAIETEGTNRSGNLGITGNLVYKNKNTFKSAEVLEIKLSAGLEAQKIQAESTDNELVKNIPFNTFEIKPEVKLFIPKLWFPRKLGKLPKHYNPKTYFSGSYSYQKRPDYDRNIASLAYGYSWKGAKNTSNIFYPFDINLLKINKTPEFDSTLQASNNTFYINSYTNTMIVSSRYSIIFSNQNINKPRNFVYFKGNIEGAGNLLQLTNNIFNSSKDADGYYHLFNTKDENTGNKDPGSGVQYAQYVKTETDLRIYNIINKNSNIVYRLYVGVGIPFTNLPVLPFVKSFFGGGANSMRAWEARTLGPGALTDTLGFSIDQIGDIKFEGNIEYRFDLLKMLEGAAFVDIGNIWLLNTDAYRPGGVFGKNFYKEIAVGIGLGVRFDFSFFIIRFDAALPVKDPKLPVSERWLFQPKDKYNSARQEIITQDLIDEGYIENSDDFNNKLKEQYAPYKPKMVFNIGIGYPF